MSDRSSRIGAAFGFWLAGAAALAPAASAAQQPAGDGAFMICSARAPAELCRCASDALPGMVRAEDLAIYSEIGTAFRAYLDQGQRWAAAWDNAMRDVRRQRGIRGSITRQMNRVGGAHRDAIKACEG